MTANQSYIVLFADLTGPFITVGPRGMMTREILNRQSRVDMRFPIVNLIDRKLDYRFMAQEAWWILSGLSRIDGQYVNRNLKKYSDNGFTMSGAYGPPFIEQLNYIIETLFSDRDSRQAVMTFWRPSPRVSKDIPCTCSLQFLIREDKIHLNVFMRSSDAYLGWPYDVFSFSMIAAYVGVAFNRLTSNKIDLGTLTMTCGSQHLYERHWNLINPTLQSENYGEYLAMCLYGYNHPDDIRNELNSIVNAGFDLCNEQNCLDHLRNLSSPNYATSKKEDASPKS